MFSALLALWHDERGATLVEYAVIAASLSVVMITALLGIQNRTGALFSGTATGLTAFAITPP
jgi:Flp pilus assembly pilin Flp